MSVENPTAVQILVAWRDNRWVVQRNAVDTGAYAYRTHAMDAARALSAEVVAIGLDCYLLIREADGNWQERPCPGSRRRRSADRPSSP